MQNFTNMLELIQNSRLQKGDMKPVLDENPHVLDAIVQSFDATATWRKVFVHSFFIPQTFLCFVYLYSPFKHRSADQRIKASNGMMVMNDKLKLAWMKRDNIQVFAWI
jgi:hypothetical protein